VLYARRHRTQTRRCKDKGTGAADEGDSGEHYGFAGSLGVVLEYDNTRLALFETTIDASTAAVFDLARARNSEEVLSRGKLIGVPGVRAIHRWAASHIESAMGADIEWRRGREVRDKITMEVSDMKQLLAAIDNTTEIIEEDIELVGRLSGADVARRTFHMEFDDRPEIRGTFSQFIDENRTFEVGRIHAVTLRRQVKVYYSTDQEEDVSFKLILAQAR
jgi:hypothetical protein